jgi:3-dehydroquinate synthase
MEVLLVFKKMVITSHKGDYSVFFESELKNIPYVNPQDEYCYLVDSNIAKLYKKDLSKVLSYPRTIVIEAIEENKSLENMIPVIEQLVSLKLRRGQTLIAIGGGIIQDITCFIASTILRGVPWVFIPTTLVSQADSCIGSKSSINLKSTKNILGTYNPPTEIYISTSLLKTLDHRDVLSGVGEILKVNAIDGLKSFENLSKDYEDLFTNDEVLCAHIKNALEIKKKYIQKDEFDRNIRNIFNYGHSFGHAIESATQYGIPHGIAVSLGMDMANFVALKRSMISKSRYDSLKGTLIKNYKKNLCPIPLDIFLSALMKDKKNTSTKLVLILPTGELCDIQKHEVDPDDEFKSQCNDFLVGLTHC